MNKYFINILSTVASLAYGLKITWKHFLDARTSRKPIGVSEKEYFTQKDGIVTLQYPKEQFPVPSHGRYQLHNEIDDCIVCDKCAKVCPVNCIDIEPVRAVEEIGKTSDGTSKKIYPAKFDIDMSKCCFCGLCTTVCPTECLTMTKEYDFSVFDLKAHNFEFSVMTTDEITEKKRELELHNAQKEKASKDVAANKSDTKATQVAFRPKVKPAAQSIDEDKSSPKPTFRPKVKPKLSEDEAKNVGRSTEGSAKPVFRPKIKAVDKTTEDNSEDNAGLTQDEQKPKTTRPVFRPKIKPKKEE